MFDNMADIEKEQIFSLIESYFRNQHLHQLVRHQIESYDNFVDSEIINTINMFNPVVIHSDHDYVPELKKYS